jgi:hypothetical protein
VAYIVIAICFGVAGGMVGRSKGSPFWIWFLISGIVPFIGLAVAFVYRHETDEPLRLCPGCRRPVRVYDALCTRCGTELEYPQEHEIIEPTPELYVKARL